MSLVSAFLNICLESQEPLESLALDGGCHVVGHGGSWRMRPRRIVECIETVELYVADERERLLELFVRLARKADDDVGGHRVVAARALDRLDDPKVPRTRV